jgi:chaperone modulatory protein CbpM
VSSTLAVFSLYEVAARCGVDVKFVEQLVKWGVIEADSEAGTTFACEVTLRVAKVVRLQCDLGVNLEGAAVIVELLDHIATLEHERNALGLGIEPGP